MSLTPQQIDLVETTFEAVAKIKEQAADLFYNRLFELDPALRPLFRGDMKDQGRKLMATLGVAVSSLRNLEKIIPTVQALGANHATYGVKESDYQTVAAALLWTLEQGLGAAFTPAVKEAWTATYTILAGVMIEAAGQNDMGDAFKGLLLQGFARLDEFQTQG